MDEIPRRSQERVPATAMATDVEFLPLVLSYKVHFNIKSSQVEIVPLPYYHEDVALETESEPEAPSEMEVPTLPPRFAPPLPALKEKKNWWDFGEPVYAFDDPLIRSRLEKLMSSNLVHVTDRKYMIRLQQRIKEDYLENLEKRILNREADEVDREKLLLLEGKITIEEAPKTLRNHPVCRINQIAKKIIEDKRSKIKFIDRRKAYKTSIKRLKEAEKSLREMSCEKETEEVDEQVTTAVCAVDADTEEDIIKGFMYTQEDYDRLKHEDPLIKLFREIDEVVELYDLADRIVKSVRGVKSIRPN